MQNTAGGVGLSHKHCWFGWLTRNSAIADKPRRDVFSSNCLLFHEMFDSESH